MSTALVSDLTPAERRVLIAYCRHKSAKAAAHSLGIAESTAKNYLHQVYARLDVESALEAAEVMGWLCIPEH